MYRNQSSFLCAALSLSLAWGCLFVAGCSSNEAPSDGTRVGMEGPGGGPGGRGPGGGPGGGGRGPGGGFAPVAATATAPEIFAQKCAGCHGDKGQGRMGPNLTKIAGDSDDELYKTIHEGKGKMPAFGKQMTEGQIKEVVAYVKGLGKA